MESKYTKYLKEHGFTLAKIAEKLGRDELWVAAVFLRQATLSAEELQKLRDMGIAIDLEELLTPPVRGIPVESERDPFIHRLLEMMRVYGLPIKAVVNEKLGDGILSAIDCKVRAEEKEENGAKRVVLSFDCKYLPFAKW